MREGRPTGTATVLFTDLVGSTDLLSRLGESAYDEVRRNHFAALREALARHNGEEVKTLGDGVLAVFGSAADAVSAGVDIQRAVDRESRVGSVALAVRVGIALGDVSFEQEDVFGTPVVEAARLVAVAQPGQILTTAAVRWAGGSRSGESFIDGGLLNLKGPREPRLAASMRPMGTSPPRRRPRSASALPPGWPAPGSSGPGRCSSGTSPEISSGPVTC